MQVIPTNFTVAEYCSQMRDGSIVVNRDYQRSSKVWPPAARSYLIDTILLGYPMPKVSLFQKTDFKSRKTVKEIVDGQQRSRAILDFYNGDLRLSGETRFAGKTLSALEEEYQNTFLEYSISADVVVGAQDDDIREMFRRINSYTVPLNPQEQRHASFQGNFKWFIVRLCEAYAQNLKEIGVFPESQLSRMNDGKLFSEVSRAILHGIETAREANLKTLYREFDASFPQGETVRKCIDTALEHIFRWEQVHKTPLMKAYNFYTLALAVMHTVDPIPTLDSFHTVGHGCRIDDTIAVPNLSVLADALEDPSNAEAFGEFVGACSSATNTLEHRKLRFRWFCRALQPKLLE